MFDTFFLFLAGWILLGFLVMVALLFVKAPYGRHLKTKGWGTLVNARWSWILMEIPALLTFPLIVLCSNTSLSVFHGVFLTLWGLHYVNRSLVYPFRMRSTGKPIPISIPLFALIFNLANGFFLGYEMVSFHALSYPLEWLYSPTSILGIMVFLIGFVVNLDADRRLRNLRKPGETGYKIPQGGLYRWVSCPNYLGEIMEWTGFALLLCNLSALSFMVWTIANLLPRALAHHRWYREKFKTYPSERRALIPFFL